ncbi:MAG: ABC-F family ATP-binding cassette domain-containing protein [Bacteroidia bacterium]|nr:ABC-F family ATP-binding cassette domain-containing protein [Bacteroidia bacterium]
MLSLENIGMEYAGRWLFRNISYQFIPKETVGLIGRNGAGKSTLLKIIADQVSPSEGKVHKAGKLKVAFFNQDLLSYQTDRSIFEVARDAFAPLLELKEEIDGLLKRMEDGETGNELWDALDAKQGEFENRGGPQMEARVRSVLDGLGFKAFEQDMAYATFSGGWRMRVQLARLLLMEPEILLLDEPTNHLDLPSIQWLESYLKSFSGSTIIVSHDRFFLDRVSEKILEISLRQMHIYAGNYTFYMKEKELRKDLQQKAFENQQKQIADQEKFINRFRAKATKAKAVQSKIKQLDKIDRIEAPEEEVVDFHIRFTMKVRSGKEVLRLKEINKAYGPKTIIENGEATVLRGDKIALIGANGTGKSTLLRILADSEKYQGQREEGYQVQSSFFAQHQLEALDLKRSIFEELSYHSAEKTELEVRSTLGAFMFSGEEVEKKIQVLSGGEKSRVALAKTLMSEANFLLLDEPTNHLDIPSIHILSQALNNYEGTYVVVSHDRFFLSKIANKIWYIEDHSIKEYPGSYEEFVNWKQKQEQKAQEAKIIQTNSSKASSVDKTEDFQAKKQKKNRLKKLEREQEKIEGSIMDLEEKLESKEAEMASPEVASDFERLSQIQQDHQEIQKKLENLNQEWEKIVEEVEELTEN